MLELPCTGFSFRLPRNSSQCIQLNCTVIQLGRGQYNVHECSSGQGMSVNELAIKYELKMSVKCCGTYITFRNFFSLKMPKFDWLRRFMKVILMATEPKY